MMTSLRTIEEVSTLIKLAKLEEKELKQVSQNIYLGNHVCPEDLVLMEVEPKMLDYILKDGSLVIRGDKEAPAVLCTDQFTYELKRAETSNSLMVLPELSIPVDDNKDKLLTERNLVPRKACGVFHSYYEVRKCKPRLKKLRDLLNENPYQGREYEEDNVGIKLTHNDLLNCIQASVEELNNALKDLSVYKIDGYYRVLDFEYQCRLLNFLLNLIDSSSIPTDDLPKTYVLDTLEELEPREIVNQCFEYYSTRDSVSGKYQLIEAKVCQIFAEILLKSAGRFHLQEFLESWQRSVPEGLTTNLKQLEGVALTDRQSKPEVIFYYPVHDLPETIPERLTTLFKLRSKWAFDDMRPYIQDLTTESLNVNALLTKYARGSLQSGVKMYSSKHPIL